MSEVDEKKIHKLYGKKKRRVSYQSGDFLDYIIMSLFCAFTLYLTFGPDAIISIVGLVICAFMVVIFPFRHGMEFKIPMILRRPQEILYTIIHKILSIKLVYLLSVGLLLLENYLIFLTPDLHHNVKLMREIAIWLFYIHFISITLYRTYILVCHLNKKEHVRTVLMESVWKNQLLKTKSITLEIWHAYFTGILTHILLIAPWYLVITYLNFSILFLPLIFILNILIQWIFLKKINEMFYREHWLGHNAEIDFVYFHGPHHDAIPSALIGVAGNGFLEGPSRGVISFPTPFYNPILAMLLYTIEIKGDMDIHQYIPGVFPTLPREFMEVTQHSRHHFGKVEPLGFAIKVEKSNPSEFIQKRFKFFPDEFKNSAILDEQLNEFKWENSDHKWYLNLVDKYGKNT